MWGFGNGVRYSMIHLERVMGLPDLTANICQYMCPNFFNIDSSTFGYQVPLVSICILNDDYILSIIHPSLGFRYLQEFTHEYMNAPGLTIKFFL